MDNLNPLSEITELPLTSIENPAFHDRSLTDETALWNLAQSMESVGLLNPVTVRKIAENRYQRVAGFRRIEAAKKLGWKNIRCIIIEATENEAALMMITENIQRENINDYDLVLSLVHLIAINAGMETEDVRYYLFKFLNNGTAKQTRLRDDDKVIKKKFEDIIAKTEKYDLKYLINKQRVLDLHESLVELIQQHKMAYSIAYEINKLQFHHFEEMEKLIEETLKEKLSREEVRNRVREIIGIPAPHPLPLNEVFKKLKDFNKFHEVKQSIVKDRFEELRKALAS